MVCEFCVSWVWWCSHSDHTHRHEAHMDERLFAMYRWRCARGLVRVSSIGTHSQPNGWGQCSSEAPLSPFLFCSRVRMPANKSYLCCQYASLSLYISTLEHLLCDGRYSQRAFDGWWRCYRIFVQDNTSPWYFIPMWRRRHRGLPIRRFHDSFLWLVDSVLFYSIYDGMKYGERKTTRTRFTL